MLLFLLLINSWLCVSYAVNSNLTEPCARVSALAGAALAKNPSDTPVVGAQVAYDCLKSIPIHKENASALVSSLIPYVNWQTSLSYLKDPPPGYEQQPTDIIGSLSNVASNINAGNYTSEYDYQVDLFNIFNSAKDQHFRYVPDILSLALGFKRNVALVSVSMDGIEMPKVYAFDDIRATLANPDFKPSAISKINGQDASKFLENESNGSFETGRDAGYNAMFRTVMQNYNPKKSLSIGNFGGDGRFQFNYPGVNTSFEWENGTRASVDTLAVVRMDFTGITDGESLYQRIVLPELSPPAPSPVPAPATAPPPATPTGSTPAPRAVGYPEPVIISPDLQVGGYYLNGSHNDTGVLTLFTFQPTVSAAEYQATIQSFLASMKKDGKTKIIVDLSTNTGGLVSLAHDAFRQFFPQTTEMSYSRYREHAGFNQIVAQTNALITPSFDAKLSPDVDLINLSVDHFNYRWDINASRQPFISEQAEFGAHTINGDKFSNIAQYDYNNPLLTSNASFGIGIDVTGYRTRANFTQPFPAQNIVLLYDGQCGSSCSIFSLNMQVLGKVKSIAMGGRPKKSPMQGIGGTRGSLAYTFDAIREKAQAILALTPPSVAANLTELKAYLTLPTDRSVESELGARDQILPDHMKDGVPAQFLNIPSDCRLFYTPQTVTDVTKMWEAAAASAWGGKACNFGAVNVGNAKGAETAAYESRDVLEQRADDAKRHLEMVRKMAVRDPGNLRLGRRDGKSIPEFN